MFFFLILQAIKEHQNFLSVFLLALPSSLGFHGDAGSNEDYSYKLPWLQGKSSQVNFSILMEKFSLSNLTLDRLIHSLALKEI